MEFTYWKEGDVIAVVTCTCGGAEGLARTALKNGGVGNWLDFPIAKGKQQTKYVLDTMRNKFGEVDSFKALETYTQKSGKYVVIIANDGKRFAWTDISRGSLKDRLDAEILIKEFA